jgi:3-hydroxyacyl-CoA dehydrogenase
MNALPDSADAGRDPVAAPSLLGAAKGRSAPIFGNEAASIHDLGDGVACFEIHTKMNSLRPEVLDVLEFAVDRGRRAFEALVVGNDDPRAFSVGGNFSVMLDMLERGDFAAFEAFTRRGQALLLRMKYAPFPVVAAAHGFTFGGGCELMLHADAIVAHADLRAGLPEVKVGLIPAWGGCTQVLLRAQTGLGGPHGPAAALAIAFRMLFGGAMTGSAREAQAAGLLRAGDRIVADRNQLLSEAKRRALDLLADGYAALPRARIEVAGRSGMLGVVNTIRGEHAAGRLSAVDLAMAEEFAFLLSGGGEVVPRLRSEDEMMALECETLMRLVDRPGALDRMRHMLATGKPLAN